MSDVQLRNAAADGAAADLEGATSWYAIGDGDTGGDQVSTQRLQPSYDAASGGNADLTAALSFTSPSGSEAVTHLLVFDAQSAGSLRFARPLSGDLSFNAAGELDLTSAQIQVT